MDNLLDAIAAKKRLLDRLRPLRGEALRAVQQAFDVELTYTSNAIEGNALTLRETAEVIEHGWTAAAKPLRDHLEAVDHHNAVQWMRALADRDTPIDAATVRELHRRITARSQPGIGGSYSSQARRIAGSRAVFPDAAEIPGLMEALGIQWRDMAAQPNTPAAAFEAHCRLVAILPFAHGNGRTAQLLMNLWLLRAGYPTVAVGPKDRTRYLSALEHVSMAGDLQPFQKLMHERLDATLDEYLGLLQEATTVAPSEPEPDGTSRRCL